MQRARSPFRWNASNPALAWQLAGKRTRLPRLLEDGLRPLACSILRAAPDADLVFVGRSLESVHDFLSGALAATSWRDRLQLLPLSLRRSPGQTMTDNPDALVALRSQFDLARLTPWRILSRGRPVAFVDAVCSGETFEFLQEHLRLWLDRGDATWEQLREVLVWVAIVERGDWNYGGWQLEHSSWTEDVGRERIHRVPIDWRLWRYLAEQQVKASDSYRESAWGRRDPRHLDDDPERIAAARLALEVYRRGVRSRRALADELEHGDSRPPRSLIAALRR